MMLTVSDSCPSGDPHWNRREFFKIGSLALGGLMLPGLLAAKARASAGASAGVLAARAGGAADFVLDKSVVLLVLQGGPPQIETFDPKMDAPDGVRSITGEVKTPLAGVSLGGTFPKLAKWAKKITVVRSFGSGKGGLSHEQGYELLLGGGANRLKTPMGAMYGRAAGSINDRTGLPRTAIVLPEAIDPRVQLGGPSGAFTLQQTTRYFANAGTLGSEYEPFNPSGGGQLLSNLTLNMSREQFQDRRQLLGRIDTLKRQLDGAKELDAMDAFQQQAYDVLLKGVSQAFDLSKEDPRTVELYDTSALVLIDKIRKGGPLYWNNFNRTTNLLGKQMLLARRLCEAGCGFVTVIDSCWDFHDDGNNPPVGTGLEVLSPQADHAIAAFLEDVERRGLSEKILLIVTAEMGRSRPKGGKSGGKGGGGSGHWGELTPLVLAGGGLEMGQVIGASDKTGLHPATEPYNPRHLLGTVMHTLFDVGKLRVAPDLPRDLVQLVTSAEPIKELF